MEMVLMVADLMWIPTDAQIDKMKFASNVRVNNSKDIYPLITKFLARGFNGTLTEDPAALIDRDN